MRLTSDIILAVKSSVVGTEPVNCVTKLILSQVDRFTEERSHMSS